MRTLTLSTVLVSCALSARGGEAQRLTWRFDGHASLPAAAREAKRTGKRLLVGLAGSPT